MRSLESEAYKKLGRSALTNGVIEIDGRHDGRNKIARRFKDIAGQIVTDQGGIERCSEVRLQLIRRFSAACVLAEGIEASMAKGEQFKLEDHASLVSSLTKIARQIGLSRRAKQVVPTLEDYLEGKATVDDAEAEDE